MKKIHQLSPNLIAQIAAGEVIERPSYAVKELIDNAIDANATEINISLENYGLKNIIISDNGDGMSQDDLLDSYKIHTTSKVKNEDSLSNISSMGFRGEALASIAAVSHLTIKSKTETEIAGYCIEVENGKLLSESPVGMSKGTVIEVSNIFANIPARKKFLKSPQTELRHIIDTFISFGLTFPEIKFSLTHNNKTLYKLPKTNNLLARASLLLNETTIQNLIPLNHQNSYLKSQGFIANPQYTTQSSTKQFLFVNNRRITDKLIFQAIKDSFSSLISDKQQPVFLLFLTVPTELVDVNVHPRKEQLAFYNHQLIYDTVFTAVSETLNNLNNSANQTFTKIPVTQDLTGQLLRQSTIPWQPKTQKLQINYQTIQQFHNLYLVVETKQGVLCVDQHAAHERILFEQFNKEFDLQKTKTKKLDKPVNLKFTLSEKILIDEYQNILHQHGFVFQNYELTDIPIFFANRNLPQLIKNLLENLEQKGQISTDQMSHKIIQFLACKQAIKAGDKLTKNETVKLLKKLEQTTNNLTCPHGRPTKYLFSIQELNKLFKRF